jgi:hypothetical protein
MAAQCKGLVGPEVVNAEATIQLTTGNEIIHASNSFQPLGIRKSSSAV